MDFSNFEIAELSKQEVKQPEKRYVIACDPYRKEDEDLNLTVVTVFDNNDGRTVFRTEITKFGRITDWINKLKLEYKPHIIKRNDLSKGD